MKVYNVNSIPKNQLIISGKGDDKLWETAELLADFKSPWKVIEDTKTEFRALWDQEHLFFCFYVLDETIHIDKTDNSFKSINVSDRVELFFRVNNLLKPYYCLEIDPKPRIMDFKALPNKDFDFNWSWPKTGLQVKSYINNKGYSVEGKISIASLESLNLIQNGLIETGVFRAKYYEKYDFTYEPVWLTWVDPKTKSPNFHLPSSFGILKLVSN